MNKSIKTTFIILFLFISLYLLFPIGVLISDEIIILSCSLYNCSNIIYPEIVPYSILTHYRLLDVFVVLLPILFMTSISMYFLARYSINKLIQANNNDKLILFFIKIFIAVAIIMFLIPKLILFYYYIMWSNYDFNMQTQNFYDNYFQILKSGPIDFILNKIG